MKKIQRFQVILATSSQSPVPSRLRTIPISAAALYALGINQASDGAHNTLPNDRIGMRRRYLWLARR